MKKIRLKRNYVIIVLVLLLLIGVFLYYKIVYKHFPAKPLNGYVVDVAYDNSVLALMSDKSLWTWGNFGSSYRTLAREKKHNQTNQDSG